MRADLQLLHDEAAVKSVDYAEDGTLVDAVVKDALWGRVREFAEGEGGA